jgi:hypothetical protein
MLLRGFIAPCLPSPADRPPSGAGWVHEIKRRLRAEERAELERRAERLRVELRLVEAELRSDEALRLQELAQARERAARPRAMVR